tara:strand:+ start:990 stop:1409 length:420 start_codon:yes stop_codon:yes gene_type:complete
MLSSLSIIAIKLWLKKAVLWCKKYWQILVGAAIPILIMIVFRKKGSLDKVLDAANDSHEKEIDAINKAYEKEIQDRESAQRRYNIAIKEIEKRFSSQQESLNSKKRKEIKKLLSDSSKSQDEITKRLSEITGFDIHVSE